MLAHANLLRVFFERYGGHVARPGRHGLTAIVILAFSPHRQKNAGRVSLSRVNVGSAAFWPAF